MAKVSLLGIAPRIYIIPMAKHKMQQYTEHCSTEVGWFGAAERFPNGDVLIYEAYLVEQDAHATTCELTPEGTARLANEMISAGKDPSTLHVWGHSHVNMGTSASGQDDSTFRGYADNSDWFVRLITNKKGDWNVAYLDSDKGIMIEDLKLIDYIELPDISADVKKELAEKVREKKYASVYYGKYHKYDDGVFDMGGSIVDIATYTTKKETKPEPTELVASDYAIPLAWFNLDLWHFLDKKAEKKIMQSEGMTVEELMDDLQDNIRDQIGDYCSGFDGDDTVFEVDEGELLEVLTQYDLTIEHGMIVDANAVIGMAGKESGKNGNSKGTN